MARPRSSPGQLDLFAPEAPAARATEPAPAPLDFAADRALAARLPPTVRLGTSSWTFPGWAGLVYAGRPSMRQLVERGLAEYARHPLFRTVGIDRSYYAPLAERDLAAYAAQLPAGFRCVQKAWSGITTFADPRTGERVRTFLDPAAAEDLVVGPTERAFAAHAGPIVFELAPMRGVAGAARPDAGALAEQLDAFFSKLPKRIPYAVELRNRDLLAPPYLDALRAHGVAHCVNLWERMPAVGEQLAIPGILTAGFAVCRLLIPPGHRYDDRKRQLAPFDRVVDPRPEVHDDVARLVELVGPSERETWIIANNKVEGSSPLTIRAIAEKIAALRGAR